MTTTIGQFIQQALWSHYRGETILTYTGDPFVVWSVQVEADMDGLHVHFRDRDHNGKTGIYPYEVPPWERYRFASIDDALPDIVSLGWDATTKSWIPIKSKYERNEEKAKEVFERRKREEQQVADELARRATQAKTP